MVVSRTVRPSVGTVGRVQFETWGEVEAFVESGRSPRGDGWIGVTGWFARLGSLDLEWRDLRRLTMFASEEALISVAVYVAEGVLWRTPVTELAERLVENDTSGLRRILANHADVDGEEKVAIIEAFLENEPSF